MVVVTPAVRRKAFFAALAVAQQSQMKWCKEAGVGHHHVGLVLNGKRESNRVTKEIDAFIARVLLPFVDEYKTRRKSAA